MYIYRNQISVTRILFWTSHLIVSKLELVVFLVCKLTLAQI